MPRHRTARQIAEIIVERCGWAKIMGYGGLTDYDPLVFVMYLVAQKIGADRLRKKPKAREAWCDAVRMLQEDSSILDHNMLIPCRTCDQAFEPVVDDQLFALFMNWYESFSAEDILAIHRCPACGGQIKAEQIEKYAGDMHTPPPHSVESEEEWAELLLQHCIL